MNDGPIDVADTEEDAAAVPAGRGWLRLDLVVTVVAVLATAAAVIVPASRWALVGVSVFAFVAGSALLAGGVAVGSSRSRFERVTLGGLLLAAPPHLDGRLRRPLRLLATIQTVVGVAAAVARPFTTVVFAVLVPMFGLGVMAWLGGRHGRFDPIDDAR